MKRLIFIIALVATFGINQAQTPLDTAVNFNVKDTEGYTIELFDLLEQDYIVIIDFFKTDCGYCNIYAPDFQESYEDFGCNMSNVYFMSIDYGHTNEDVIAFEDEHGLTLPACSGEDGNGNAAFDAYQITGTPTYVVIAPDKEILEHQIWPPESDSLNAALLEAGGIMASCATRTSDSKKAISTVIYPNPVTDGFSIRQSAVDKKIDRIRIHNISGKLVMDAPASPNISTDRLNSGMYFVSLFADQTIVNKEKIIIRK